MGVFTRPQPSPDCQRASCYTFLPSRPNTSLPACPPKRPRVATNQETLVADVPSDREPSPWLEVLLAEHEALHGPSTPLRTSPSTPLRAGTARLTRRTTEDVFGGRDGATWWAPGVPMSI